MITTHVLDTSVGQPAVGMAVVLAFHKGSEWVRISDGRTDEQGRLVSLTEEMAFGPGVYRLTFDTATYYRDVASFFPEVQVIFRIRGAGDRAHIPLLISPFGYSTYKGT
jgi:5-hydroxyisourate hydrolase